MTTPDDEQREFLSREDFNSLWEDARHRAGLDSQPGGSKELFIYPILVLYAGFFFGPFGTALMGMATLNWRVPMRLLAIFMGLSGTTWLLVLGVTQMYLGQWTPYELQFARSTLNFLCGMTTYIIMRRTLRETHSPSRRTLHRTIAATIILVSLYFVIPPSLHITLGR
jgi:hypothetical protein